MNAPVLISVQSDRTLVVANPPVPCPGCDRVAAFLVNRCGSTLCTACDDKRDRQSGRALVRALGVPAALLGAVP